MSPSESATESVVLTDPEHARVLAGHRDRHLRLLRDAFDVRLTLRGETLTLRGEAPAVRATHRLLHDLQQLIRDRGALRVEDVQNAIRSLTDERRFSGEAGFRVIAPGRTVHPRSPGQVRYVRAMNSKALVFCAGPAGTGKTYLAVAAAVASLRSEEVRRIVLTRPAVEAGEKLGYLPGDYQAKVSPYLRPLYDALGDMAAPQQIMKYIDSDIIEVAPLAYMRGRTLDHAFIILDEGQNCTSRQMRMFLTRLGASSRAIVTGDISQTDLPPSEVSGMVEAMQVLRRVHGVGIVRLGQGDIVRHRLVQDIVNAYESNEAVRQSRHSQGEAVADGPAEEKV